MTVLGTFETAEHFALICIPNLERIAVRLRSDSNSPPQGYHDLKTNIHGGFESYGIYGLTET